MTFGWMPPDNGNDWFEVGSGEARGGMIVKLSEPGSFGRWMTIIDGGVHIEALVYHAASVPAVAYVAHTDCPTSTKTKFEMEVPVELREDHTTLAAMFVFAAQARMPWL